MIRMKKKKEGGRREGRRGREALQGEQGSRRRRKE